MNADFALELLNPAWFIEQNIIFTNLRGIVMLSGVFGAKHPAPARGGDASGDASAASAQALSMTPLLVKFVKHH
ncbi:MAG: hypothetical protein IPM39_19205 [Chloroflexi bacterium]|nr:hypothetical protein [Chloroflexota bacterium]